MLTLRTCRIPALRDSPASGHTVCTELTATGIAPDSHRIPFSSPAAPDGRHGEPGVGNKISQCRSENPASPGKFSHSFQQSASAGRPKPFGTRRQTGRFSASGSAAASDRPRFGKPAAIPIFAPTICSSLHHSRMQRRGKNHRVLHRIAGDARLSRIRQCRRDSRGLSPFNPGSVAIEAGRLMLQRMDDLLSEGTDFAFETTLATRSYVRFIEQAHAKGYFVTLLYFWLPTPQQAVERVATRVREGGQTFPAKSSAAATGWDSKPDRPLRPHLRLLGHLRQQFGRHAGEDDCFGRPLGNIDRRRYVIL